MKVRVEEFNADRDRHGLGATFQLAFSVGNNADAAHLYSVMQRVMASSGFMDIDINGRLRSELPTPKFEVFYDEAPPSVQNFHKPKDPKKSVDP